MRKNKIEIQIEYLYSLPYPNQFWSNVSWQYIRKKLTTLTRAIYRLENFVTRKHGKIFDYWMPKIEGYKELLHNLNEKFA